MGHLLKTCPLTQHIHIASTGKKKQSFGKWASKLAWRGRQTLMKIFETWYSCSTDQTAIPKNS